jgi:hypothetical protein
MPPSKPSAKCNLMIPLSGYLTEYAHGFSSYFGAYAVSRED